MFTSTMGLSLTAAKRADLEHLVRATSTPAGIARRMRCILLLADGATYTTACRALAVTDRFIARWKQRYVQGGVHALADAPRSGRQDHRVSPACEARIVHLTQHERPPRPLTHWTSPRLAARGGSVRRRCSGCGSGPGSSRIGLSTTWRAPILPSNRRRPM